MKTFIRTPRLFIHVLLGLTLAGVSGCYSSGYRKGEGAARSLQRASTEVQNESRDIDVTLDALKNLITQPAADLRPQFRKFSAAVDRLEDSARQTERTRERVLEKSADYFETWDEHVTGIHYERIRAQSEARKTEVTNHLHAISTRYQEAEDVVRALITYFKDIRTALSVDLTLAGLDSVKEIVSNAEQNAGKVKVALSQLSDELASSGTSMSSMAVRSPPQHSGESRTPVRTEVKSE